MKKYEIDTWMTTYSGIHFEFADPKESMFNLDDACRSLAMINRFLGHTLRPYSVAEHLCRGHDVAIARNYPVTVQNEFVIHDMSEGYYGDLPSPVKALLGEQYKIAEDQWQRVINTLILGYPDFEFGGMVKHLDIQMCCTEASVISPHAGHWYNQGISLDINIPKTESHWSVWYHKLKEKVEAIVPWPKSKPIQDL